MPEPSVPSAATGRAGAALVVAIVVAVTWALVAPLPLLSESYTHLELVRGFTSPWDAFDPAIEPFRPLQHLTFYLLHHLADGNAAVGRALTFTMHGGAALLVFTIALRLGATRLGAAVALAAFLAWPSAKGLTWVAAVSGPARTLCLLVVVWATIALVRRPRRATAWVLCGAFVVGLAFHQSVIVAPVIVATGSVALASGSPRQRLLAPLRLLREPALLVALLVAAGYVLFVGALQERGHHGVVQAGAIAANVARASLALAPEWLRVPALEGLRGHGGLGFAGGAAAVAVALAVGALAVWRGGAVSRWLLLLIPLDLLLPVATTGFVGRYAHFAAALAAITLGLALRAAGRRWRLVATLALVIAWAADHAVDVVELRRIGATMERLLARAAVERALVGPDTTIALVDAPDHGGGDDDVDVFNWGLPQALARSGVAGPWLLLRVDKCWTPSDHRAVREDELPAAVRGLPTLRFDPRTGDFERWPR